MQVRPYEAADRGAAAQMDASSFIQWIAQVSLANGAFQWCAERLIEARSKKHDLADYLGEEVPGCAEALVAVVDGQVRGFAAYDLSEWNGRLTLLHMYVDNQARGQGVGTTLLDAVLRSESADRAQHVWLETQTNNVPAIRAYERMGFSIVGLDQSFYGHRCGADTALFMARPLR